jgi:RsiW-degrading membrane proteinase PrsW (M82 family)
MKYGQPLMFLMGILVFTACIPIQTVSDMILKSFLLRDTFMVIRYIPSGIIEEVLKFLPLVIFAIHIRRENILLYASWVALGFAMIENALFFYGAGEIIYGRFLLATPAHLIFGLIVAFFWRREMNWKGALKGLVLASVLHALLNIAILFY